MKSISGEPKMTVAELRQRIDDEARSRLGMSGQEFIDAYLDGTLPATIAASEIAVYLIDCLFNDQCR